MCGIAGIILSDSAPVDLMPALSRMRDAIRHRGPDDNGIALLSQTVGGFVNTRLAILDLSAAGHQPMITPDGRYTITYNGEIYNYRELRSQLLANGYQFRSNSDTEVLLQLYATKGPEMLNDLIGMFALAIWDSQEKTCFLARDPLGIKPLYYSAFPRDLVFASEVRALLQSDRVPKRMSSESLFNYFLNGTVAEPATLIEGIRVLPAGHYLIWRDNRLTIKHYWHIEFSSTWANGAEPAEYLRDALLQSVRRHFVSDVPVGVFLSGGIDSSAVVALAKVAGYEDLRTFSISLDDPHLNEGDAADRTAKHFGTRHTDWRLTGATGAGLLDEFIDKIDRPTIDGFNTFCVSKVAHDAGLKVVLSGLGGDELFGGYQTFRRVPLLLDWGVVLNRVPNLRQWVGRLLEKSLPGSPLRRMGSFLEGPLTIESAYQTVRGVFTPVEAASLCRNYLGDEIVFEKMTVDPLISGVSARDAVAQLEMERYMRNQLLRDSDVFSMAFSLELRVPFVDRQLVDSVTRIPAAQRLRDGKQLLVQAVPEIPPWVVNRKKQGFVFPFANWMKDEWRAILAERPALAGVPLASWYQKWSIFVFEKWLAAMRIELQTAV
jgi:asparagine synthase (glutamine-hydrolysing)